ncbi:hypothetical protein HOK021_30560 [Streptomyces hygroscopicus]|nr:hypothetical protein HOK021_30560 [Streptomyces hygroscopicus]
MPALDHRLIRLKALPDGFHTEFIETAERGQTERGEESVEHVKAFRMADLDAYPTPSKRQPLRSPAVGEGRPYPSALPSHSWGKSGAGISAAKAI